MAGRKKIGWLVGTPTRARLLVGAEDNQSEKEDTNQGKVPWSVSPPTTKL